MPYYIVETTKARITLHCGAFEKLQNDELETAQAMISDFDEMNSLDSEIERAA